MILQACGHSQPDAYVLDGATNYVDIYDVKNNSQSHLSQSQLGQARRYLAAASLPSGLVFFAGGWAGIAAFANCDDENSLLLAIYRYALMVLCPCCWKYADFCN